MKKSKLNIGFCLLYYLVGFMSIHAQPATNKKIDYKPKGVDLNKKLSLQAELNNEDLLDLLVNENNNVYAPIDILNNEVYYDKNINSNVFYYLPGSFRLNFNKRKGNYKIKLAYPEDHGNERKVNFTAQFVSSVDKEMEKLLERLLFQITKKTTVKALPLRFDSKPVVEFSFSNFDIPKESISISENTDYTKPITVSWSAKINDVAPFLASMADDISFDGKLFLNINGDSPKELPIHLSIVSPKTIGNFYYKKPSSLFINGFKNETSFPVKIKNIIVLNSIKSKELIYKKYPLFNTVVKPLTTFDDFNPAIKKEIRSLPTSNLLLEYEILECEECETNAVYSILNNRITTVAGEVVITDYKAYDFTKAKEIRLSIESIYKNILVNKSEIDENGFISNYAKTTFEAPKKISGKLFYKYRIFIYTQKRSLPYRSRLIKSNEPSIDISEDFIKKHFREFKYKKL